MTAASTGSERTPFVFAPTLRIARILWRVLPWFAYTLGACATGS